MTPTLAHALNLLGVLASPAPPQPAPIVAQVWKPTHPGDEPPF